MLKLKAGWKRGRVSAEPHNLSSPEAWCEALQPQSSYVLCQGRAAQQGCRQVTVTSRLQVATSGNKWQQADSKNWLGELFVLQGFWAWAALLAHPQVRAHRYKSHCLLWSFDTDWYRLIQYQFVTPWWFAFAWRLCFRQSTVHAVCRFGRKLHFLEWFVLHGFAAYNTEVSSQSRLIAWWHCVFECFWQNKYCTSLLLLGPPFGMWWGKCCSHRCQPLWIFVVYPWIDVVSQNIWHCVGSASCLHQECSPPW